MKYFSGLLLLVVLSYFFLPGKKPGVLESLAIIVSRQSADVPCDRANSARRISLAKIVDRYGGQIKKLWVGRESNLFPDTKMVSVGPLFFRVNPTSKRVRALDSNAWSWEDAHGHLVRSQDGEAEKRNQSWRDLDQSVRFLLEKDWLRVVKKEPMLPPDDTEHSFWPKSSVRRSGKREIEVKLKIGEFKGSEKELEEIFTSQWSKFGWKLKVVFSEDEDAYLLVADKSSRRSLVNHRKKQMLLENYAWTKTVAHELGHILGFADHYYTVWHEKNCYYTQESRLNDIMSSSDSGVVTLQHWAILDKAYPLGGPAAVGPLKYRYQTK